MPENTTGLLQTKTNRALRIAFAHLRSERWTAGLYYLQNIFQALRSLPEPERPAIILLVSPQTRPGDIAVLRPLVDEMLADAPAKTRPRNFLDHQRIRLLQRLRQWQSPFEAFLRHHAISAFFTVTEYGPCFGIPLLTWIPDFQYRHMPDLFSTEEITDLTKHHAQIARHATRIILSSRSAAEDFKTLAPEAFDRVRLLPFVAQIPDAVCLDDLAATSDTYQLPKRFFYVPNQFWKHKNHMLIVEALAQLKTRHPDLTVVCSGNTHDSRNPLYFGELLENISRTGLRQNMIILGMVPRFHLFQLIRQSLAVLQPSLFEGWSSCVEEAKSLGKRVLLSDIPVHREQAPPSAIYFNPREPSHLAHCLSQAWQDYPSSPDTESESKAHDELPARTRRFAASFMDIVNECKRLDAGIPY